jgi:hypothetical protein
MACEINLLFNSLIFAALLEIKINSNKINTIFVKIIDLINSECLNECNFKQLDNNIEMSTNDEILYEKYKMCYENSKSIGRYLQNGRYNEEFIEKGLLGTGGFGHVYRVFNKLDHKEYALKKVRILGKFF